MSRIAWTLRHFCLNKVNATNRGVTTGSPQPSVRKPAGYSAIILHTSAVRTPVSVPKLALIIIVRPVERTSVFQNLVKGNWNAQRPLSIVVSDMTCIWNKGVLYEWTLLLDTFNNEIIAHGLSRNGNTMPYYQCLDTLKQRIGKKNEQSAPVVLHTDQGAVYSSRAYQMAHADYTITRSMSRTGTPTDNPIIEALNGWIKEELYLDFDLRHTDYLNGTLDRFVTYFNHYRLAAALGYKSPVQFKIEQGFS